MKILNRSVSPGSDLGVILTHFVQKEHLLPRSALIAVWEN